MLHFAQTFIQIAVILTSNHYIIISKGSQGFPKKTLLLKGTILI